MDVRQQWAQFLNEYRWNYFITCRTPYKIYTRTVSSWIDKLYCNSDPKHQKQEANLGQTNLNLHNQWIY